jgi:coenzyme PQQ precursor peptide PqqA
MHNGSDRFQALLCEDRLRRDCGPPNLPSLFQLEGHAMAWTTPTLVEICIGLEINGYLPAEF